MTHFILEQVKFLTMGTYKALVFDLGKVVFDLSFDNIFRFWASASGTPYGEIKSRFQFDETFDQFERADLTPEVFRALLSAKLGLILSDQAFDEGWCALYLDAYAGINGLLADLSQRYQLVALTNTNSIHSDVWKVKYADSLHYFQKVFSSHEIKARKPEALAYQTVLDYLQVSPQHVLFLDDNPDNIAGARQLGINTILVTSYDQMTTALQAAGLLSC